jgi:hypothetical protein
LQQQGFSTEGIVAGTLAPAFMATYKGLFPFRSTIAVCKSTGAAGLGGAGIAVAAGVGGFVGYHAACALINLAQDNSNSSNPAKFLLTPILEYLPKFRIS